VGLLRNKEGTGFFDPNLGLFKLPSNAFDEWVVFHWKNMEYTYKNYSGKVFQKLVMSPPAQTPAQATQTKARPPKAWRKAGDWSGTPGTGPNNG
jgi:hypothetical protein